MFKNKYLSYISARKIIVYCMILYLTGILQISCILAAGSEPQAVMADFNMTYKAGEKSYIVNDGVLPEMIGSNLPYSIHCTNLSKGDQTYEWFVKSPGSDYKQVDSTPNPVIKIGNYGPTYIRLRINGSNKFTKEYCVTAKEYCVTTQKEEVKTNEAIGNGEVPRIKTVLKKVLTYISAAGNIPTESTRVKTDKGYTGIPEFKISYQDGDQFYNVTNGLIPKAIAIDKLPAKVILTNTTGVNTDFCWYMKYPGGRYTQLDGTQNKEVLINQYGTTMFKLVLNGNESSQTECGVTLYHSSKQKDLEEVLKSKAVNNNFVALPEFKINYISKNSVYDVTNSIIPGGATSLPYNISLINLSKGENTSDWSIKVPGSSKYEPIGSLSPEIKCFGPVQIRLCLNNDDTLVKEYHVDSYFSLDNSDIVRYEYQKTAFMADAKPDFKIISMKSGTAQDITNGNVTKGSEPETLYMANMSTGNESDEWFIKLPGNDYVPMDNTPSPVAKVWKSGRVYFKLRINGDDQKTLEYFVDVYSPDVVPKIVYPSKEETVPMNPLTVKWNQVDGAYSFKVNLYNQTKRKMLLTEKYIKGMDNELVPVQLLDEGCKYSMRVTCLETGLSDTVSFYTEGMLNLSDEPLGGNSTIETSLCIKDAAKIQSKLSREAFYDYFKVDIYNNSEISINLSAPKTKGLAMDLLDANHNISGRSKQNDKGNLNFSKVLRPGSYYVKIYSNQAIDADKNYTMTIATKIYTPKILLLYTGYGNGNAMEAKYPAYTDQDIDIMLAGDGNGINTTDFLISSGLGYYGAHQAIPKESQEEIINSISIANNSDLDSKEIIKNEIRGFMDEYRDINGNGVKVKNPNFIPYDRTLESFADESVDLATRLIKRNPDVRLWFSFPTAVNHTLADKYIDVYKEKIILGIKNRLNDLNPDYWRNNVVGFYFAQEDIPRWYTSFETKDKAYLKDNPIVKTMNSLSQTIHEEENKMFLWIPYLGSEEQVERVGHVANANNIFDYVMIQPSRMFDGTGYYSKGSGDDEISILTDRPKSGEDLDVNVKCRPNQTVNITVLNRYNSVVLQMKEMYRSSIDFSFTPSKGLYTIIVSTKEDNVTKTYSKSIYVDKPLNVKDNLLDVQNAVKNNSVFYRGVYGGSDQIVVEKTSDTIIGFEMEIDAYAGMKSENIDFSTGQSGTLNSMAAQLGLSQEDLSKAESSRAEELNSFYKFLSTYKKEWYNQYVQVFKPFRSTKPYAFYAGERNELFRGMTFDVLNPTMDIYNEVREFFGSK